MIIRVIDCETCGLPPDNMQVVEVATVDLVQEGDAWTRGRMWSSLVNPQREIPPVASGVHHIIDDMVNGAPTIDQLREKIWLLDSDGDSLGSPNFYAAHNAKFEVQALGADKGSPPPKFICTWKAAALAWPELPSHKNQVLRYFLKLNLADPSLAAPHRASGDAYVTAALLRRMLSSFTWTPEQMWERTSKPIVLPRLHFGKHVGVACSEIPLDYWSWVEKNITDDEDVLHTARFYLNQRRAAQRNRSPV